MTNLKTLSRRFYGLPPDAGTGAPTYTHHHVHSSNVVCRYSQEQTVLEHTRSDFPASSICKQTICVMIEVLYLFIKIEESRLVELLFNK